MSTTDTSIALANGKISTVSIPIKAVEKETGVSKELLRMWERRYGFPAPVRDKNNDRMYPQSQVERLRIVRRLIDAGFRPGKIINLSLDELKALITHNQPEYVSSSKLPKNLQKELFKVLKSRNPMAVSQYLNHQLVRIGLEEFVLNLMQHTNTLVGDAWMRGDLEIFEEHLYTEQVTALVKNAIGNLTESNSKPRIMITTAPEELHTLGTLMIEALLRIDQINAINYGAQLSITEIKKVIARHEIDVVMLSFSGAYPTNRALDFLEKLRLQLPIKTEIWAGGSALHHTRKTIDGIIMLDELTDIRNRVLFWQRQHGQLRH